MMKRIIFTALITLGCFSACGPDKGAANTEKALTPEPAKVVTSLNVNWPVSEVLQYQIHMDNKTFANVSDPVFDFSLKALLDVVPLKKTAGKIDFMYRMKNVVFTGSQQTHEAQYESVSKELLSPIGVSIGEGKLVSLSFVPGISVHAVGVWRAIAAAMQFPEEVVDGAQSVTEYDASGEYVMKYSLKRDDGNASGRVSLTRQKLKYNKPLRSDGTKLFTMANVVPTVQRSTGLIAIDGFPKVIESDDAIQVAISAGGSIRSSTSLKIVFKKKQAMQPELSAMAAATRHWTTISGREPYAAPLPIDAMDTQRMGSFTFDSAVAILEKLSEDPDKKQLWGKKNRETASAANVTKGKEWTEKWSKPFAALPAFFRQQPDTISKAKKLILADSPAANSLLGGLSAAGTPEAQQVLVDITLDTSRPERFRKLAARNLILSAQPSTVIHNALATLLNDPVLADYGILGTGTVARNTRDAGDDVTADRLSMLLVNGLTTEKDTDRQTQYLRGIANSGCDCAYQAVLPYLKSGKETVRIAAVESMRLMKQSPVESHLIEMLNPQTESSKKVRIAAVETARVRPINDMLVKQMAESAQQDPEPNVRYEAIRTMSDWLDTKPHLVDVLKQISQNDDEPVVRLLAAEVIGNAKSS